MADERTGGSGAQVRERHGETTPIRRRQAARGEIDHTTIDPD
jgi:hypothetical protein